MILTSELPIYRDVYLLSSLIIDYAVSFPKLFKFSLGSRLIDTSFALLDYIQLANRAGKDKNLKAKYLSGFLIKFESLKTLIRMCSEKHILSIKQSVLLAKLTTSIGKLANAWKNS